MSSAVVGSTTPQPLYHDTKSATASARLMKVAALTGVSVARAVRCDLRNLAVLVIRSIVPSGSFTSNSVKKSSSSPAFVMGGMRPNPSAARSRPNRAESQASIKS